MRVIENKSYADSLDAVVAAISARERNLDERHLVIVPAVYTFALENRLFSGGGSFDVEVVTFDRLYVRLGGGEAIGKQGAIMLLKRICRTLAPELECYSRSATKSGFAVKLYDEISNLRAAAITADDLFETGKNAGGEGQRIRDVARLYREYERATKGKYIDFAGRMEILSAAASGGEYRDCHIYVALYDDLTMQIRNFLRAVSGGCLSLDIYTSAPPTNYKTQKTAVMACPDRVTEYKEAAKRVLAYLRGGGKTEDICVVDERGDYSAALRVFREFSLPVYAEQKIPLSSTELVRYILHSINAVRKHYRTADMLALSANYYTQIPKTDVDSFSRLVRRHCVDYLGFTENFVTRYPSDPDSAAAESVRKSLINRLRPLETAPLSPENFVRALNALLLETDAETLTESLGSIDGRNLGVVYEKTTEIINSFSAVFSGESLPTDAMTDILREGFEGVSVSLVPNRSNTVQIGRLSLFRGRRPKYALLLGFNDGVLPLVQTEDEGLTGAKINGINSAAEINALCRGELWHFLTAAENLFISFVDALGKKPAYDLKLLVAKNSLVVHSSVEDRVEDMPPSEIVTNLGCASYALEIMSKCPGSVVAASVAAALPAEYRELLDYPDKTERLAPQSRALLLGDSTSVSALQTYFLCPYRYFLGYGLGLRPSDDGKVTPIDIGLLLHRVIELFVQKGLPQNISEFVAQTLKSELASYEKYTYSANERTLSSLSTEAEKLCAVVASQLAAGEFEPLYTEASFGKPDSTLTTVSAGGVNLMGVIDRVDIYGDYARVIDYKTGKSDFVFGDVYYGKKIQLCVYMAVLIKNGYRPAGMFYFPFSSEWTDDEYTHRLAGVYNCSPEILEAFDRGLSGEYKSSVIEANMKLYSDGLRPTPCARSLTEDQLARVARYSLAVAEKAIEEIRRGYILPSPAVNHGNPACSYCDYVGVCGANGKNRVCGSIKSNAILSAIGEVE